VGDRQRRDPQRWCTRARTAPTKIGAVTAGFCKELRYENHTRSQLTYFATWLVIPPRT